MVTADQLTDEDLCQLLDKYLHIDARPNFAAADAGPPAPIQQKSKHAVSKVSVVLPSPVALSDKGLTRDMLYAGCFPRCTTQPQEHERF